MASLFITEFRFSHVWAIFLRVLVNIFYISSFLRAILGSDLNFISTMLLKE